MLRIDVTEIELFLTKHHELKGLISKVYAMLSDECLSSFASLKDIWERDLEEAIDQDVWLSVCSNLYPKCTSINIHELNFKFIHRFYLTPLRLHRIFPERSDLCFKC